MGLTIERRRTSLGIEFWYEGDDNWPDNVPKIGKNAEAGCIGCGWYDFDTWRNALNQKLAESEADS